MNTFWLIFHYALLAAAIVWAGRLTWGKIQDLFRPGL